MILNSRALERWWMWNNNNTWSSRNERTLSSFLRRPIKLVYERTLKPLFRISMLLDTRTADYRCFVLAVRYLSNDSTEKGGGRVQPCVAAVPWNVTDHAGRTLERDRKTRCCNRSIQPGGIVEETQDVPRGALARAHANMSMTLVRNTFKGKLIFFVIYIRVRVRRLSFFAARIHNNCVYVITVSLIFK